MLAVSLGDSLRKLVEVRVEPGDDVRDLLFRELGIHVVVPALHFRLELGQRFDPGLGGNVELGAVAAKTISMKFFASSGIARGAAACRNSNRSARSDRDDAQSHLGPPPVVDGGSGSRNP